MSAPTNKDQTLILLLVERNKEIAFWRERNWTAFKIALGAIVGSAGLSLYQDLPKAFGAFPLLIAGLAELHARKNKRLYNQHLSIRSKIEKALGLFEEGRYLEGEALYPQRFRFARINPWELGLYRAFVWSIAALASCLIVFGEM